ncbi:DNA polymerase-3 subunit delta' [Aequitasia blattaphilus]|uniref:DNA polymerase III subunit delta n=1 Tax=Aequitasia blattaphilus TaxID=2949332 RepID=A0ABT1EBZ8_9FIRM|nr:DNA polymerase III subunit delta' [Aequitasia blattaphilus]MCP1102467.1 DNA polymerase III subunit delta' [Aequitasia blattaphilus]MCR8615107.1 DNA polymerase III subunit delta' [Aequitasia blattaphilus]
MESFKDVIGHSEIIEYIRNAVSSDKIAHAYIVNGNQGAGKKMLAKLFAMTVLCENSNTDPCGTCPSCLQAESMNHPDLIWVNHEKPATIGVDDVRAQINNTIHIKPYKSEYKVYIMPEADKMTEQAQNALLKTLEEPPSYVIFLLLTSNAKALMSTITSRCVILRLRNIKETLIKKYLMENMNVPDYQAEVSAAFSQGNLGQGIMLAKSEHFNALMESALRFLRNEDSLKMDDLIEAVKESTNYKVDYCDYLDIFTIWYRDILLYKATKDIDKLIFKNEISKIKEMAKHKSYEDIELVLKGIENAKERLRANVNFDLVMELLFHTMKETNR